MLVDGVDFRREERPSAEGGKVLQGRIAVQQASQFHPGRVRLDVGEVELRQFGAAKGLGCWGGWLLCHSHWMLCFLSVSLFDYKGTKNP